MKTAKKLTALLLAIVMVLAMSVSAFAMDGHEVYLSPAPGTDYTTITTASSVNLEVYFSASTNNTTLYNTGFDSAADAQNVVWSVKNDPSAIVSTITKGSSTEGDLITATAAVSLAANKHGVAIITATYGTYTLDLTICVESATAAAAATGVTVEIADARYENSQYSGLYTVTGTALSVAAITNVSGHAFANDNYVAKSFPSAFGALCQMVGTSNLILDDGYVTSITATDFATETAITLTPYMDGNYNYYGWNYCVVRNGSIVAESLNISSTIFELQSGDRVIWAFGTSDEAAACFDMLIS